MQFLVVAGVHAQPPPLDTAQLHEQAGRASALQFILAVAAVSLLVGMMAGMVAGQLCLQIKIRRAVAIECAVYVAKTAQLFHVRLDCEGLSTADRPKLRRFDACSICAGGVVANRASQASGARARTEARKRTG